MLTLNTPITVPNIQKMHVVSVSLDGDANVATVVVVVQGTGNIQYGTTYTLSISDVSSVGLRATVSPLGYTDRCELFSTPTPGLFTTLVAAYTGAIAARNRAAETTLQTAGLLPAGVVS